MTLTAVLARWLLVIAVALVLGVVLISCAATDVSTTSLEFRTTAASVSDATMAIRI